MAKTKKKTNKKDAGVPKATKNLNDIVKKRKQEQEQESKSVKFIEWDCYVRYIAYGDR